MVAILRVRVSLHGGGALHIRRRELAAASLTEER
jgi:hypothetical protein